MDFPQSFAGQLRSEAWACMLLAFASVAVEYWLGHAIREGISCIKFKIFLFGIMNRDILATASTSS